MTVSTSRLELAICQAFANLHSKDFELFKAGWVAGMGCPRGLACRWPGGWGGAKGYSCSCPSANEGGSVVSGQTAT